METPVVNIHKAASDDTSVQADFSLAPANYEGKEPMFVISSLTREFDIYAADDGGGNDLKAFKNTAKSFTDLPNQCIEGFQLAVIGDNNKDEDNFHVSLQVR